MEGEHMSHYNEVPSDAEVITVLQRLGTATARDLALALESKDNGGHERRNAQRAVQRCLDRGKIVAGSGLRLSVASVKHKVAA
jgi:hypothetical protein